MPLTNSKDKKETHHICGGFLLFKKVISDITLMHYSFSISFTTFNIGVISNDKINADSKIRKIFVPSKNIKLTTYPKRQNTIKKQIK